MHELYGLCDAATLARRNIAIERFVAICNEHNAAIIQYRDKISDDDTIKENLLRIKRHFNGILIVNDRIDAVAFCDGLHLGQEDLAAIDEDSARAVMKVRDRIGADKMLGISTHDAAEIERANALELDYIGLGAYRATSTKQVENILGDRLDKLAALATHKVAAIGGVRLEDRFEHVRYLVIGSGLLED